MRPYLFATLIAVAPVAAQAANCPTDMSALKPVLAYQMQDYSLPPIKPAADVIAAMESVIEDGKTVIEQDYNHKLTFKGTYAVNDADEVEVKKEIDNLNKSIELVRILRCQSGK